MSTETPPAADPQPAPAADPRPAPAADPKPAPAADPLLHLNPPQRQAVTHDRGPLLILAGAGSGKTRVITHRLAELVRRGVPPSRILAVTFTNKAARELRARAAGLLGEAAAGLWVGTFHAVCARLLRPLSARLGLPASFTIAAQKDQLEIAGQVARELQLSGPSAEPRALLSAIDEARDQGQTPAALAGVDPVLARAYARYEALLRARGALDFGDLLLGPLRLCAEDAALRARLERRFDHVLVDEFQDVNPAQHELLRLLSGRSRELMVVGDDDQAIYGWRGADVRIILRFAETWPDATVVRLEQNYRSTQLILDAANALIRRNRSRHDKALFSERKGGAAITLYTARDERREAEFVATTIRRVMQDEGLRPADFAVCFRVHAQARALEEALRAAGLRSRTRRPQQSVVEEMDVPAAEAGAAQADAAAADAAQADAAAVGAAAAGAASVDEEDDAGAVSLLTVHAAKGLEFPVVFVTGLEEGLFPSLWRGELEDPELDPAAYRASAEAREALEEERRLAYVAITRAKDRLYLCHARKRQLYGDYSRETEASRFLDEIPAACLLRQADAPDAPWQKAAPAGGASTVGGARGAGAAASPGGAASAGGAAASGAAGGFQVGQRVRHATFGEGEVRGLSGAGDQLKLAVYFASAGPKTLLARFLKPVE